MAQTGYTPIQIYSSSTGGNAPAAGNLLNNTVGSELAINITDGKLFYKDNANAVQVIAWKTTPTTAGGTGLTSYTAGDLLYYATGTTLSKLAIGTAYYQLGVNAGATAPAWQPSATSTLTTQGDLLYASAANTLARLAKNTTATRYLANTGTDNNPAWAQINVANGVTGTLPATNGGTGFASYAVGDLLYADTTTSLAKLADVATGNALISGGVGVAPSWGKIGLTTHVSGTLAVGNGGTGATTLTGYVKGNGASAFTASSTIPNTDITGLGTMSTQAANNVAITGGSITGVGPVYASTGTYSSAGPATVTLTTLPNTAVQKTYLISASQQGAGSNFVLGFISGYGTSFGVSRVLYNSGINMDFSMSGNDVQLVLGSGFGTTTWRWYLLQIGG